MPPEQTLTIFSQYGLSGLVIAALFYLVFTFIKELKLLNDSNNERFEKQSEMHAEERKQWIETSKETTAILRTLSAQLEARLK